MESEETLGNGKSASSNPPLQWIQWQLVDSLLPTGGFAHSSGLESAVQSGFICSPAHVQMFIIQVLENTASLILPFVYSASRSPTYTKWQKLDSMIDATLTNETTRNASIAQGSALMKVAASVFTEFGSIKSMRDAGLSSAGDVCFHHAPVFGIVCGIIGFGVEDTQRAYLFMVMRDVISSATRLNLIGPIGASILQHKIATDAEKLLQKYMNRDVDECCYTCPVVDLVQGCHTYLFSRLFRS